MKQLLAVILISDVISIENSIARMLLFDSVTVQGTHGPLEGRS